MRVPRPIACLLLLYLAIGSARGFALEVAELRNGYTIPHRSREVRGATVRLYMDDARKTFVDLPSEEIQGYSIQPDPEPAPSFVAPTVQGQHPAAQAPASAATPAQGPAKSTDQIVREASSVHGVDSDFIHSVIQQESAGNPRAVSPAGARGLMQLMPGTAAQLGVQDSFSPEQNVHGGARYLRELLERYHGDAVKALAAYNAGPGAVDRYRGVPPYRETRLYVQRIVRQYNQKKQNVAKPQAGSQIGSQIEAARKTVRPASRRPGPANAKAEASLPGGAGNRS
jgi:hypothetical protein